jgi:hypothetical protein
VFAVTLILLFSAALFAPRNAYSIPAFARKYETSCQTCHVAAPALTPFGEAFRENGYRFPQGQDPSMTKTPAVPLGAEGYKKLWPKAVWPGEIPGLPPLAVLITSTAEYDQATDIFTFGNMGGEMEFLAAGTLGEHLSFWGSVVFARDGEEIATEMERLNLLVRPLDDPTLQFKVGSFEPGIMLVSSHRSILDQEQISLTEPIGDNLWAPEAFQQGVEAYGMPQHRLLYNAGVVEGSGSVGDKSKDVYARLAYKFGGLAFDGFRPEGADAAAPTGSAQPWSEVSLAVSGFVYRGRGILAGGDIEDPDARDGFRVLGGDVAVNYLDLQAHAGYTDRKDDRLYLGDPAGSDVKTKNQFGELSWVALPWLIPAGRWESSKVGDETTEQISFTANGLVRANVKTFLAANWVKEPGGKFTNEGATLGVLVGF